MARTVHVTKTPVELEGYQAILKPSKFGFSLSAIVDDQMVATLETDRVEALKWAESKLKNPKRSTLRPEPWEEVAEGRYKVKFSWNEDLRPTVVDSEGTLIDDVNTPIYSGSAVKLAFEQRPYILKDGVTYGTSLKLKGVQVVTLSNGVGVDRGTLSEEDVASLFGTTDGFKVGAPNIQLVETEETSDEEVDF